MPMQELQFGTALMPVSQISQLDLERIATACLLSVTALEVLMMCLFPAQDCHDQGQSCEQGHQPQADSQVKGARGQDLAGAQARGEAVVQAVDLVLRHRCRGEVYARQVAARFAMFDCALGT